MRLFVISFMSILFVGFILLTARIWGLSQVHTPYHHPLLQTQKTPQLGVFVTDSLQLEELRLATAEAWAILPVRISADKKIFILDPSKDSQFLDYILEEQKRKPQTPLLKGQNLSTYDFDELQKFFGDLVLLETYYQRFPNQVFVLNLIDNISEFHAYLKQVLSQAPSASERTLVMSETHVLLTATKEQLPELVFGSSMADITRLMSLESLGVIAAAPLKADVLTTPLTFRGRPLLKKSIVDEMRRRHKKVFVTDLTSAEIDLAKGLEVDGYFFKSIEEFRKVISSQSEM